MDVLSKIKVDWTCDREGGVFALVRIEANADNSQWSRLNAVRALCSERGDACTMHSSDSFEQLLLECLPVYEINKY